MVPKAPSRDRIHGTHKGRPDDADNIPAKPMIPMFRYTCSRSDEYQHHRCYSERNSRCVAAGRGRPFGAHSLGHNFLFSAEPLCLWTRSLLTTFLFAGPLCLWTRSLLTTFFSAGPLCFWTRSLPTLFFPAGPLCLWTLSLR
ncbi:hypothetical protein L210DRAFT_2183810 [Boletus edulis BED1]|uniref:Uncharacterized protein n=1 Tax=Boletus edulis BED1 TaxID=1328754 RepID=A0AAD4GET9_BOLED|nr:hypothetical protein L210DRAFT_2183810 [Boletus edulis BED1]